VVFMPEEARGGEARDGAHRTLLNWLIGVQVGSENLFRMLANNKGLLTR
jgi:hypothetical protein